MEIVDSIIDMSCLWHFPLHQVIDLTYFDHSSSHLSVFEGDLIKLLSYFPYLQRLKLDYNQYDKDDKFIYKLFMNLPSTLHDLELNLCYKILQVPELNFYLQKASIKRLKLGVDKFVLQYFHCDEGYNEMFNQLFTVKIDKFKCKKFKKGEGGFEFEY